MKGEITMYNYPGYGYGSGYGDGWWVWIIIIIIFFVLFFNNGCGNSNQRNNRCCN